jgi:ligand-binding SRPBCC domain-containing protein
MQHITLERTITANAQTCFDAARNIGLHLESTAQTHEIVVSNKKSGLCELGEFITCEGKHFGITQQFTSEITKMEFSYFLEDKMKKGAFKSFRHEHYFEDTHNEVTMTDHLFYEVPLGVLGKIFDGLILRKYLVSLLQKRNEIIKHYCENKK